MKPNPGHCPAEAEGKRINGVLVNGGSFEGWAADGKSGCNWRLRDYDFDIAEYDVAG